jgi:cell division protein FtsB
MVSKLKRIKKSKESSKLFLAVFNIILLALIIFLGFSAIRMNKRREILYENISKLEETLNKLEEKKNSLEARISYQGSEEYVEEVARDRLGLKAIGEKSVSFIKDVEEKEEKEEEKSFFDNLIERIKFW